MRMTSQNNFRITVNRDGIAVPVLFYLFLQSMLDIFCKVCYAFVAKLTWHFPDVDAYRERKESIMKTKIRELRKARKLSQEELAEAVGTTRQTITSIEVGKYTASLPLAYKIAKFFGLTIEEVFDFSDLEE